MLGPFATASRRTPPVLHCNSPGVATVARAWTTTTTRDRGDRYGPTEWAQLEVPIFTHYGNTEDNAKCIESSYVGV